MSTTTTVNCDACGRDMTHDQPAMKGRAVIDLGGIHREVDLCDPCCHHVLRQVRA